MFQLTAVAAHLAAPFQRRLAGREDDRAAALIEYAFLVALIAVVCILAITFFGGNTSERFSNIASSVD